MKAAWAQQISRFPERLHIRINAALLAFEHEPRNSSRLLKDVLRASPANLWARYLLKNELKWFERHLDLSPSAVNFDFEAWRVYANQIYLDTVVSHGERMPPLSAQTLESVVAKYPDDVNARAELIGYYRKRWQRENLLKLDPDYVDAFVRHQLWCIMHVPGSEFVFRNNGFFDSLKKAAPHLYDLIWHAWLGQIQAHPDDAAILASAAAFFARSGQTKRAKTLMDRARKARKGQEGVSFHLSSYKPPPARETESKRKNAMALLESLSVDTGVNILCPHDLNTISVNGLLR